MKRLRSSPWLHIDRSDLIEKHSEALVAKLLDNVRRSEFTPLFASDSVPAEELKARDSESYRHLGERLPLN